MSEAEKLINELGAWCAEERGRQAQVAKVLGVRRSIIKEWLKGRALPGYDSEVKPMDFLDRKK